MCGIAGTVGLEHGVAVLAVEAMCARMVPRGPDDSGIERLGPAILGSRRLSIIDPSPAGHQPMADPERGTTIVFNGMIYNFAELRRRLAADGERFRSHCDTEVVLRAYGKWGHRCVDRLEGMFAFAIWDPRDRSLFLARDRLGIKPLYLVERPDSMAFSSQVKALLASRLVSPKLDPDAVRTFLSYGAVTDPLTAIEGIRSLEPGSYGVYRAGKLQTRTYWSPPEVDAAPASPAEAREEFRSILGASVRRHLVSDAPLGIFLSGGLDSSLVAALAAVEQAQVRTVSVVFDDPSLTETAFMERVAAKIGSEHISVLLEPEQLATWLDDAFDAMDQPSFDGLNTYVVSRAAADTGLKVALSGLGADELFDGYGYAARARALERVGRAPRPASKLAAGAVRLALRGDRADKVAYWFRAGKPGGSYELLRRLFLEPELERLFPHTPRNGGRQPTFAGGTDDLYGKVSRLDLANYMRNVLLRDTDAMSMSRSLEVRVPYLDDRLVEWALRQPGAVKGERKGLMAPIARELLPPEVLARPKQGFLLPLRSWMRRELAEDIGEHIRDAPKPVRDLVDASAAEQVWRRYLLDGRRWLRPWSLYALSRWVESLPTEVAAP